MTNKTVISLFIAGILVCVGFDFSLVYALAFGFVLFFLYGLKKGISAKEMAESALSGVKTIKNILVIFLLIGVLTAVWRASGTIPSIIYYATKVIVPEAFIFITFILCCIVSFLTGTSFGTAATIGVICMTMSGAIGADPLWVGGAMLSGAFFGDRCSPMSTSALLTSTLTKTNIYKNIKLMIKSSLIPFIATCIVYLLAGFMLSSGSIETDIGRVFSENFNVHWINMMPALLIILLSIFKVNVKKAMIASISVAVLLCLITQNVDLSSIIHMSLNGYSSSNQAIASMLNGGGIKSMIKVICIVCISSSYSGMFDRTGLLNGAKDKISKLVKIITPFGAMIATSIVTVMISCNQTLAIMLTHQLSNDIIDDKYEMAVALEDTVVVIAALIPWSIAAAVPLTSAGAPMTSIFAACYLYMLPMWNFIVKAKSHKNQIHIKTKSIA